MNYMVADGWDRRDMTGGAERDNPAFRRQLNQLKRTEGLSAEF